MKKYYCETLYQAAMRNHENLFAEGCIYNGKEGCLRLAREYGAGLQSVGARIEHIEQEVLCR